jgi:hypothetical protein
MLERNITYLVFGNGRRTDTLPTASCPGELSSMTLLTEHIPFADEV